MVGRACSEVYSHLMPPLFLTLSSQIFGQRVRSWIEAQQGKQTELDISGHALVQTGSVIQIMHTLQSFADHDHGFQEKFLALLAAAFSITDGIFLYHTTAYNHSIVDILSGVALPAIGYVGTQLIGNYVWGN